MEREGSLVICGEKGALILSGVYAHRGRCSSYSERATAEVEKQVDKQVAGRDMGAMDWLWQFRIAWRASLAVDREVVRAISHDVASVLYFIASLKCIKMNPMSNCAIGKLQMELF